MCGCSGWSCAHVTVRVLVQAAAALMLGAEGVVIGTRLVATDECNVHQRTKQALVEAGSQVTFEPMQSWQYTSTHLQASRSCT